MSQMPGQTIGVPPAVLMLARQVVLRFSIGLVEIAFAAFLFVKTEGRFKAALKH